MTPETTYVCFDTEGTGVFDYDRPADAEGQPRLAAITLIWCNADGEALHRVSKYVKPDGWTMPPEALAVNGLSTEFLMEHGSPISEVLDYWEHLVGQNPAFVAYNAQHDMKQIRAEFRRAGRDDMFARTRNSCLMRAMKPYKEEGLPMKSWMVKLSVVCEFFGITNEKEHDSGGDAEAARQVMARLIKDGRLLPATIHYHYAKTKPASKTDAAQPVTE